MYAQAVPERIWRQQVLTGMVLLAMAAAYRFIQKDRVSKAMVTLAILIAVLLLAGTFIDSGVGGVHRWVRVGPALLYSSSIAAPLLILVFGRPAMDSMRWSTLLSGGCVSLALAFQPDAAQTMAFSGALITLWLLKAQRTAITWIAILAQLACIALAWSRPDPLPPVRYVEGIVLLAAKGGLPLLLAALGTLVLLPLPFFFLARRGDHLSRAWALGVYFSACLIAPIFGAFPVPVMGFGASPIIGYVLALTWLLSRQKPSPQ
jgi:hypothetical protein